MDRIYTSEQDERIIESIKDKGLAVKTKHKWVVLRLALANSLKNSDAPEEDLDNIAGRIHGGEYNIATVTGRSQEIDYIDVYRAMLSVYHNIDLFSDDDTFRKLLQRHIRRGLKEFRANWDENFDFYEYLYKEFLSETDESDLKNPDQNRNVEKALTEIGVAGEIESIWNGPRITRYMLHLNNANDLDKLKKGLEKLSFILGLKQMGVFLKFSETPKLIGIDIPRPSSTWKNVRADKIKKWTQEHGETLNLPICAGVDIEGEPYVFDLALAPHIFVAGTTGSGKSVCLHSMILSLLCNQSSEDLKICLIDPKRVEFSYYDNIQYLFGNSVIFDYSNALKVLSELLDEMESREKILSESGVRDIIEYRKHYNHVKNIPWIVVIIEEVADLLMQDKSIEGPLVRLTQKGRASGIHLILATQRPDSVTFSGLLRSNIPSRIALTVQKSSESKIIIDETGAEKLSGKGDMLLKLIGKKVKRIHGLNIKPADIASCLNSVKKGQ
ncbi:DNA translocase FtsK [Desulfobacterales bacterium HSG17]|nr:DNA translocase FtsK [Desulfobacterales bacterium HSG17]